MTSSIRFEQCLARFRSIGSVLILLCLASCSHSHDNVDTSPALFTLSDLQAAQLSLADKDLRVETSQQDLNVKESEFPYNPAEDNINVLDPQAVLPDTRGYVVYIRHDGTSTWQIFRHDQALNLKVKVFQGTTAIDSVAINGTGNILVASIFNSASNSFDLYRFRLDTLTIEQLTNTALQETNISQSQDGNTLVWQSQRQNLETIFYRRYDGASFTQHYLLNANAQVQPSVTGDGHSLVLVEELPNARDRLRVYDLGSQVYTNAVVHTHSLEHPSLSNDKTKLMYLQHLNDGRNLIRIKNLIDGTIATERSSLLDIEHPHLTPDGAYVTFGLEQDGYIRTRLRNIDSNAEVNGAGGNWHYVGMTWQQPGVTFNHILLNVWLGDELEDTSSTDGALPSAPTLNQLPGDAIVLSSLNTIKKFYALGRPLTQSEFASDFNKVPSGIIHNTGFRIEMWDMDDNNIAPWVHQDADWIQHNITLGNMLKAAKAAGHGFIVIDPEPYSQTGWRPFWSIAEHRSFGSAGTLTDTQLRNYAKQRGMAWAEIFNTEWPDAFIHLLRGPEQAIAGADMKKLYGTNADGSAKHSHDWRQQELMGWFLAGFVENLDPRIQVTSGGQLYSLRPGKTPSEYDQKAYRINFIQSAPFVTNPARWDKVLYYVGIYNEPFRGQAMNTTIWRQAHIEALQYLDGAWSYINSPMDATGEEIPYSLIKPNGTENTWWTNLLDLPQ
jgi:hypothetical protein